jgi:hypothetical protein
MALMALVYVSFATHEMSDDDLQTLLQSARDRNAVLGITGMLLYRDRYFIQLLEGKPEVVDMLYAAIKGDSRHTNLLVIHKAPMERRLFEGWSMGFSKVDTQELQGFTDFLDKPFAHSTFAEHPSQALELLEHFRDRTYF